MPFQLISLLMEPQNKDVGRKLFIYTLAMFSLPIFVFYICRYLIFAADTERRDMWSGFTAVASVNVIIVLYVVSAFREDREEVCQPAPAVGVWATRHAKERTD
ncbi:hypothetical protein NSK_007023 [Nannochloropsis salina CCMP1776]|uniref:Vacuolar ATPase assembly integral membrane protein VMA21 homolog n=1 Tax=Nannochloropsis salina CCMP1776 TaxID=1027361 RepID=A0A4D9CW82_9STRA|nr:hypothetical protein NSK_007023 [Nannochloropsis salina CCMP1776]|eukprot:TFJ81775.1 hypothetical protein NSK_007023 [Nannochloropsis salina CCMP1776]